MPIDAGTLAGHDQLLSVSQEAINRQLEILYRTPARKRIPNGPTHLINHQMNLHKIIFDQTTNESYADPDGLDAYICCPKIELGGQGISDHVDRYRDATIRFKFRRAESWEITKEEEANGKQLDSVYTYSVKLMEKGRWVYKPYTVVLNDWEISWTVRVERRDIQDVFEDILKHANSTDSHVTIEESVQKKLSSFNSSNFQISTIFCAMQSARLIRSFSLVDGSGKLPDAVKNTNGGDVPIKQLLTDLPITLTAKFAMSDLPLPSSPNAHLPTPDNPFVLGYTVSQKKPALELFNPAAAKANIPTPAFFIPKSFHCSLSPKNKYSEGTLNFFMNTNRAMQPPDFTSPGRERTIDYGKDDVGRFSENVFTRLKTHAMAGSAEGALFFCQDIFVNHWIGSSIAPLFYLSPDAVAKSAAALIQEKYKHAKGQAVVTFDGELQLPKRALSQKNEYKMTNTLRSGRKIISRNAGNDPTESIKLEYDTTLEVKYENLHALQDSDEEVKRRLKFTIGSYTFIKIKFFRRLLVDQIAQGAQNAVNTFIHDVFRVGKVNGYQESDSNWEEAYDANLWLNFKHTFEVGTSAENMGSFTVENSNSEHLNDDRTLKGGTMKSFKHAEFFVDDSNGPKSAEDRTLGVWKRTETHNWAGLFEFAFEEEKENLTVIGDTIAKEGASQFQSALEDLVKSLGATVILPAGDVFMFKGMSADDQHNVFTTITYNTPTSGSSIKIQPSKVISHSGAWVVPTQPDT